MVNPDLDLGAELSTCVPRSRVLTRPLDRVAYASDASFYRLIPRAVVQPESINEVISLFTFSHQHNIPLTFRAAGTSLSGQAITDGILVDVSRHWRNLQTEDGASLLRVQPGVIGAHANAFLRPHQRRIGPDPASMDACMLGGILANNSSGMCCGVEENSYRTLHSMTVVLPNGYVLDSAAPGAAEKFKGDLPRVWNGLLDLRKCLLADDILRERVHSRYRMKNTTGYSLNALLDYEDPLGMLSHLMVGSEGTLGFIAEVVLHTLPEYPMKLTGMLYFPTVQDAARAIPGLRSSGARALEIMDRAALRSVEKLPGAPAVLAQLPEAAAALLVEYQDLDPAQSDSRLQAARAACRDLRLLEEPAFTREADEQAALWKLRKGMFPSIGATRRQGTSVIIEDVAFPVERLADAIHDLHGLFHAHGYDQAIIFGHARDGNLHFVITQSFNEATEVDRYERFMADLVALVSGKYDGALKAEHGTGRNMAPFVANEWGAPALGIMRELKSLLDPSGLLNPGVILNPDPHAHVRDLKTLPVIEPEVDRCIECGFCEPNCPSRRLTMTPRQRIVVRREIIRSQAAGGSDLGALLEDYRYAGLDTCVVDGLCATACPVTINTGDLVKHLRADAATPRNRRLALLLVRQFKALEMAARIGIRLGHVVEKIIGVKGILAVSRAAERLTGLNLPKWNAAVLHPTGHIPATSRQGAEYIYFPSCISRTMGTPAMAAGTPSLIETFLIVAERAKVKVWIPEDTAGHCCGMPFGSKGYQAANQEMLHRTIASFWDWSEGGRLPVVIDTTSCTYTLRTCSDNLSTEDQEKWQQMTILDSLEFIHDGLLPRLPVKPLSADVILHPNCGARKMNLAGKMESIARVCSRQVTIPQALDCCAFAGDRGLLFPELTASATAWEAAEVNAGSHDGYYCSNLTCEMGMSAATGKPYRSILYLVEQATRNP